MGELLGDTIDATLTEYFSLATPKIENIKTTVSNQAVKVISRRVLSLRGRNLDESENLFLFFDLGVSAEFEPTGSYTTAEDVAFGDTLVTFFGFSSTSSTLIEALNNTSSAAEYFKGIDELIYTDADRNAYPNHNEGGGNNGIINDIVSFFTNNVMIITIASVSVCAVIILIVGVYMIKKRRRTRMNVVEDAADEPALQPI